MKFMLKEHSGRLKIKIMAENVPGPDNHRTLYLASLGDCSDQKDCWKCSD